MKKFLTITAIVVAVLLSVAIIAPMALRGKIAGIVKHEANELLQAKLDFEKLDISLLRHFPHASLELKGLTLVGVERFAGDTIVAADRISVVVNLMSLFGDSGYEVSKILLNAPAVHAHKLADGTVNWNVMKPSDQPEQPQEEAEPSSFRFSVRDLRISDAWIRYEDDSTKISFVTTPADLRLRGDLSSEKTQLDLQLKTAGMRFVSGGIPLLSGAEAQLDARIDADLKTNRYTLSKNKLRLNAIAMSLDGWVELHDDGSIALDMKAGCDKVQFKDVLSLIPAFYTREFKNLAASGELAMSLWARGEMRGSQLPAFELITTVKNGSFQYSSLPKAVTDIHIAARVANPGGVLDKTEVNVSQFALKMAGNSVAATLYATNLISDPRFRATASGRVDLGAIREVYPLDKEVELNGRIAADVKVAAAMSDVEHKRYEQIAASGSFTIENLAMKVKQLPLVHIRRMAATITPQAMTLGEFGVTVGRSDLSANGQLSGYIGYLLRGDLLTGRLYVKSDLIDLNELIESMPTSDSTTTQPAVDTLHTEAVHALVVPKNLNLSLSTDLHKVLMHKMSITDISGEMRVAEGAVSLERLALQLFGGKAAASGSYSTALNPARPALAVNLNLVGASFSKTFDELELVQQLVPLFAKTGGDYSMTLAMTAALDAAMNPDLKSVNASGEIRSENIRIQNLEVFSKLATVLKNEELRQVEARDVAIRFVIRDGRITTQPFDLKIGGIHINMSGSTGLDQTIDYAAKVALPGGGVIQTIPVQIGGTFTAPKVTLGVKDVVADAVKGMIDDQVKKLTGSESLAAEVEKQAARLREEARRAGERIVAVAEEQRTKLVEEAASKGALAKFAAQKAGDKLVAEAEKQAAKLQTEAENQIAKLSEKRE